MVQIEQPKVPEKSKADRNIEPCHCEAMAFTL